MAEKWGISERSIRNYCAQGKISGARRNGKKWIIPQDASCPKKSLKKSTQAIPLLLERLLEEKKARIKGGIYHKLQIELTYNSNHIEGSKLSQDQTRYIYETNTILQTGKALLVDDILETANHFRCIDIVLDQAMHNLTESFIKRLHLSLKNGSSDSRKEWFLVGAYKKLPNEVGGTETTAPELVEKEMKKLLADYKRLETKSLDDILDFHYRFERIHPFQDGNGRIGRLILLKECLKHNIVPSIIDERLKLFYYRGLSQWPHERGYLRDTFLSGQDTVKRYLDYFRIPY